MITTERLVLRPPATSDRDAVFAYASDSQVMQYLSRVPTTDPADSAAFLQRCLRVWESGEAYVWAITLPDGSLIGMIEGQPSKHGFELSYGLNRVAWGNGYMTEALQAIVGWALSEPEVYRVWAYVNVGNVVSQRVLEKAG
ncbi:MAG: GNAT family N-acetyltransferase, partial [Actinobacteria bacterium]|nr:GNAT family N-acetyltransferase [Actinomycetota bacterium]